MRIIAGKWRGHPLVSFKADHIRPTTDRVKESLFNIWQLYIEGATVLDLFCGTGNLGLEALSRGASHVTFVDKHPKSIAITKQNIGSLKVEPALYKIVNKDVLSYLKTSQATYDLIFIDPPFTEKMAHQVMEELTKSKVISDSSLIAIESSRHERMENEYDFLERYDFREYGDKVLSLFSKK